MNRRRFLMLGAAGLGAATFGFWPDEGLFNPCLGEALPDELKNDSIMRRAWTGIDPTLFRDCHVHLIGTGDSGSGIWLNPEMSSIWHPIKRIQYFFYMDAACIGNAVSIDEAYVERLAHLASDFPVGAKFMLLAFDYFHDKNGNAVREQSPFHTPNDYAARVVAAHPDRFEWIASIHPYRKDVLDELDKAVAAGAKAIKWLAPAMGIDPSSPRCDTFYDALVANNLPLLTHAGHEHAVDAADLQALANPLLLRRPLDRGVRVIVAHCATTGSNIDIDQGGNGPLVDNVILFARLMAEPRYRNNLYADISAVTQINRTREEFEMIYRNNDWHPRLLYGSDYPLPGVMPIFSLTSMVERGYINNDEASFASQVRRHNPLMFDFLLKRLIKVADNALPARVFEAARVFAPNR